MQFPLTEEGKKECSADRNQSSHHQLSAIVVTTNYTNSYLSREKKKKPGNGFLRLLPYPLESSEAIFSPAGWLLAQQQHPHLPHLPQDGESSSHILILALPISFNSTDHAR